MILNKPQIYRKYFIILNQLKVNYQIIQMLSKKWVRRFNKTMHESQLKSVCDAQTENPNIYRNNEISKSQNNSVMMSPAAHRLLNQTIASSRTKKHANFDNDRSFLSQNPNANHNQHDTFVNEISFNSYQQISLPTKDEI